MKIAFALFWIPLLLTCCEGVYIKNKLNIESFKANLIDSNSVSVYFDVSYYADSTLKNFYDASIEKGQNGSDQEVLYFGIDYLSAEENNSDCKSFLEFQKGFNEKLKPFRGEELIREFIFCFSDSLRPESELIMILKDSDGSVDTIHSRISQLSN